MAFLSSPLNSSMPKLPNTPRTQSPNPYVFIVGCPRSGTTMMKRMVNAHPMVAITRETHWIPRCFEKKRGVSEEGRVTEGIVDKLFEHHRFAQMKISRDRLLKIVQCQPELTYAALVSQIFDRYGERKKKLLVGDKTPTYVRKLPILHTLWPNARIIHLIRDGRDVCLSMRNWRMANKSAGKFSTWDVDPVVTTALWWKALVGMGRRDGKSIGNGQYHEVNYELLVAEPDVQCRKLANFLSIPHVETMERYYEGRTHADTRLSTNAAWLPPTPGRRNWRDQMADEDVERFEAVAGDLLEILGYELAFPHVPPQVAQYVDAVRQQFTKEANKKKWRLPDLW